MAYAMPTPRDGVAIGNFNSQWISRPVLGIPAANSSTIVFQHLTEHYVLTHDGSSSITFQHMTAFLSRLAIHFGHVCHAEHQERSKNVI